MDSNTLNNVNLSNNVTDLIRQAEERAKQFTSDKLKTNQIRNFYSAITRMRSEFEQEGFTDGIQTQLVMLKPKLAYAAGRQKAVKDNFYYYMTSAIEGALASEKSGDKLKKFFALVEAVVAYHKFYGGDRE
jgi:CRISPR-associated protein Csm2